MLAILETEPPRDVRRLGCRGSGGLCVAGSVRVVDLFDLDGRDVVEGLVCAFSVETCAPHRLDRILRWCVVGVPVDGEYTFQNELSGDAGPFKQALYTSVTSLRRGESLRRGVASARTELVAGESNLGIFSFVLKGEIVTITG
jgi:hypothetical protein